MNNPKQPNYADYLEKLTSMAYQSIKPLKESNIKKSDYIKTLIMSFELLLGTYTKLLNDIGVDEDSEENPLRDIIQSLRETRTKLDMKYSHQLNSENKDAQYINDIVTNITDDKLLEYSTLSDILDINAEEYEEVEVEE